MQTTQQYLYKEGTTPQTRTVVNSKVKIFSFGYDINGWQQIAVIGSMSQTHSRGADPIRGIGFGDQIAEMVPSVSDPITLSVTRTAIYTAMLQQVFGYAGGIDGIVRSLKHHRWPFDIKEEIIISELEQPIADRIGVDLASNQYQSVSNDPGKVVATAPKAIITQFIGCWFTSLSRDYASDSSIVSVTGDISATDVIDPFASYGEFIRSGNAPETVGRYQEGNSSRALLETGT